MAGLVMPRRRNLPDSLPCLRDVGPFDQRPKPQAITTHRALVCTDLRGEISLLAPDIGPHILKG